MATTKTELLVREAPSAGAALHWIGGRWLDSGEHRESINPATGEVIGSYAMGGGKEAELAVDASLRDLRSLDLVARVSTHRDNPRQAAPDGHTAYAVIALRTLPTQPLVARPCAQLHGGALRGSRGGLGPASGHRGWQDPPSRAFRNFHCALQPAF